MNYSINNDKQITLKDIQHIIDSNATLVLSDKAKKDITACREYLDKKMASQKNLSMVLIQVLALYVMSLFLIMS